MNYFKQDRLEAAEAQFREALQLARETLPENHLYRANAQLYLGKTLLKEGRAEDALTCLLEGRNIRRRAFAEDHHLTIEAVHELSRCLIELKRFDEAERELLSIYSLLSGDKEAAPDMLDAVRKTLIELYTQWNKPESVKQYRQLLSGFSE